MSTPTSDADEPVAGDPIADERGKQGTNYPHGVGEHPETTRTSDVDDPIASERGSEVRTTPRRRATIRSRRRGRRPE